MLQMREVLLIEKQLIGLSLLQRPATNLVAL